MFARNKDKGRPNRFRASVVRRCARARARASRRCTTRAEASSRTRWSRRSTRRHGSGAALIRCESMRRKTQFALPSAPRESFGEFHPSSSRTEFVREEVARGRAIIPANATTPSRSR